MSVVIRVKQDLSVGDLVRVVLAGRERTAVLVDEDERLYGVVSEGDLLKAIWNGLTLEDPILNLINPNPLFLVEGDSLHQDAIELFVVHGALLVPVVDQSRKVINVINVREVMEMKLSD